MYAKINGSDDRYIIQVMPFITQHGNRAVTVVGDMPQTDQGFKIYDDDDKVYSDFSDYTYFYGDNSYTTEEEEIEEAECSFDPLPETAFDRLSDDVGRINTKVNELTPYEETKTAYYNEKEKVFYNVPNGNMNIYFDNYDGEYEVKRYENRVVIEFPIMKVRTNITLVVQ